MATFFGNVSDSESESLVDSFSDRSSSSLESDRELLEGFDKWRKRDADSALADSSDEGEDSRAGGVKSAEAKAEESLEALVMWFEAYVDEADYVTASEHFREMVVQLGSFSQKFERIPNFVLQALAALLNRFDISPETGKPAQSSKDFETRRQWTCFAQMARDAVAVAEKYSEALAKKDEDPEALRLAAEAEQERAKQQEEEEEIVWNAETMKAMLLAPSEFRKRHTCEKVLRVSKAQQLVVLQFGAHCHLTLLILGEELANNPTVSLNTWSAAFGHLNEALKIADTNDFPLDYTVPKPSAEDETEEVTTQENTTLLAPGPFGNLVHQLVTELLHACRFAEWAPSYFRLVEREQKCLMLMDRTITVYLKKEERDAQVQSAKLALLLLQLCAHRRPWPHQKLTTRKSSHSLQWVSPDLPETLKKLSELVRSLSSFLTPDEQLCGELALSYGLCQVQQVQLAHQLFVKSIAGLTSYIRRHRGLPYLELTGNADTETRLLYNRTMMRLAIGLFLNGDYAEAAPLLRDLISSGYRLPTLVGQKNIAYAQQRRHYTVDQEMSDRRRNVPPHHQLSLRLAQIAHLLLGMVSNVRSRFKLNNPQQEQQQYHRQERNQEEFRALLKQFGRRGPQNALHTGKPGTDEERIVALHKAILRGSGDEAQALVSSLGIWNLCEDVVPTARDKLQKFIALESLQAFLLSTAVSRFETLSLTLLAQRFKLLSLEDIRQTLCRLVLGGLLFGYWLDGSFVFDRSSSSDINHLSIQSKLPVLAEKCVSLSTVTGGGRTGGIEDVDLQRRRYKRRT